MTEITHVFLGFIFIFMSLTEDIKYFRFHKCSITVITNATNSYCDS